MPVCLRPLPKRNSTGRIDLQQVSGASAETGSALQRYCILILLCTSRNRSGIVDRSAPDAGATHSNRLAIYQKISVKDTAAVSVDRPSRKYQECGRSKQVSDAQHLSFYDTEASQPASEIIYGGVPRLLLDFPRKRRQFLRFCGDKDDLSDGAPHSPPIQITAPEAIWRTTGRRPQ